MSLERPLPVTRYRSLPDVLFFEGLGPCFYVIEGTTTAQPKRGQFYVSGGPPAAWRAPNDLGCYYIIVRPTTKALQRTHYIPGEAVVVPPL